MVGFFIIFGLFIVKIYVYYNFERKHDKILIFNNSFPLL